MRMIDKEALLERLDLFICGYETEVAQMRYCPNRGARMENVK